MRSREVEGNSLIRILSVRRMFYLKKLPWLQPLMAHVRYTDRYFQGFFNVIKKRTAFVSSIFKVPFRTCVISKTCIASINRF